MTAGPAPRPSGPAAASGAARRAPRVLVLDDEEAIRRTVKMALARHGCEVETAANGRQGLQTLLRKTFDVAVVDVRMQEMDGIAFVQEAKKIWPWQGVVLYSGFLDDRIVELARAAGVQHILNKPVDMNELATAVFDEAGRREKREQAATHALPMNLISYQLNMMRRITQDTLHARSLLNAMASLGQAITEMLPCHALGILAIEEHENALLLKSTTPLPTEAADQIRDHMVERYQMLAGRNLPGDLLNVERLGPVSEHRVTRGLHSIASVPVLMGDEVRGIMTLASCDANAFDDTQISLLYHAAGNLATLLGTFGEMRRLAVRDPLTGLYNRMQMDEELDKFWSLATRHKQPMALLMLDIDHFKSINDRWGHHGGDAVVKEFADFLKETTRTSDIVARYGGDEFVIILPQADRIEATNMAARLLDVMRKRRFHAGRDPIAVTASIGIAVYTPGGPTFDKHRLIDCADRALYQAKNAGRDGYHVWSEGAEAAIRQEAPAAAQAGARGQVLVIDDEEYILVLLRHLLEADGYQVQTAGTLQEARTLLTAQPGRIDLALCDLSLPDGNGLDLLAWCRDNDPLLVTVVISGNVTADNAITALRNGAFDFLQKPLNTGTLSAQIDRAVRFRQLQQENARYHLRLEEMVRAKNSELSHALEEIKVAYEFTLETMVAMLDAREFETGQHSVRVRDLTLVLARALGIEGRQLEEIGRGALLHDIGKVGIPDSILLKPGPLTEDEWEVMRRHPEIGHRFLTNSAFLQTAAALVLSHHERWDGTGYPQGLSGERIDLGARIFAVIDAYDAMRSSRVYKSSSSMEKAVAEIRAQAGRQFDPQVVEAFLRCVDELEKTGRWSSSFV